jgi:hypothetical protein
MTALSRPLTTTRLAALTSPWNQTAEPRQREARAACQTADQQRPGHNLHDRDDMRMLALCGTPGRRRRAPETDSTDIPGFSQGPDVFGAELAFPGSSSG